MIDYFKNIVDRTLGETESVKPPVARLLFNESYVDPARPYSDEGDDPPYTRKHSRHIKSTSQQLLKESEHKTETNTHPKAAKESKSKEMRSKFNSPPDRLVPGDSRSDSPSIRKSEPSLLPNFPGDNPDKSKTSTVESIAGDSSLSHRNIYNTIVNDSGIVQNEDLEERDILVTQYNSNTFHNRFFNSQGIVKDKEILMRSVQPTVTEDKNNVSDKSPVVTVSIGKIEIKPKQQQGISKEKKKSVQYTPPLSLGTYLKNMSGRKP